MDQAIWCCPDYVRARFPNDQVLLDLRAESYIGATLWNHTGVPIGLIATDPGPDIRYHGRT